jgi:hypothetical protein
MSVAAPASGRAERPPERAAAPMPARGWWWLLGGCLALAALSLVVWVSAPTYDPWAWIMWGREITEWDLVTTQGPSWKPLPVLFTTAFALAGDDAAPQLWLLIARAGGLLAFAMAYRLGARLAGPAAGVIAAVALVLSDEFIRNFARGNSEGLLVAFVLWAVERHLDGRRVDAFLLGFAASLLRPELWPFWGLYGLWLLVGSRVTARRTVLVVVGSAVACLAVWFVPEYLGSGDFLRAAERARDPNPDSAAFADSPFLEVFDRSSEILSVPVYVGAVLGVVFGGRLRWALAGVTAALMVAVAAMTEAGFAGNLRYVALPAAIVCVLAGAGWVDLVRFVRERWSALAAAVAAAAAAAAAVPFVAADARALDEAWERVIQESDLYGPNLQAMIAKAGGADAIKACGPVVTGPFEVQALAYRLHVHGNQLGIFPFPPGTAVTRQGSPLARDPRYPRITETTKWTVGSSCPRR